MRTVISFSNEWGFYLKINVCLHLSCVIFFFDQLQKYSFAVQFKTVLDTKIQNISASILISQYF
jgi:hypothetical protein